jgi:histidine triad (HIT) family protein
VNGEVPCYKIWEDEDVLAFLSNFPMAEGHTIVIPKKHSENIFDIDKENIEKISNALKEISFSVKNNLGAEGVNIVNNSGKVSGQEVFHMHFHILPRYENDGRDLKFIGEKVINKNFEEIAKKIKGN